MRQGPRTGRQTPRSRGPLFSTSWLLGKLTAAAVLGAAVALFRWGAEAPDLRGETLLVNGNVLVPAEEIAASLALQPTSIFRVRGARLEAILETDPAIEQATVRPRLPNLIEVRIHERSPVAVWDNGVQQVLVDASGLALRPGSGGLPTVHGPTSSPLAAGAHVDSAAVRVAQALTPRLDALGLSGARFEYERTAGVSILAPGSYRVALGDPDKLDAKLLAYRAIRQYLEETRTRAELIDVRFLERPYFR